MFSYLDITVSIYLFHICGKLCCGSLKSVFMSSEFIRLHLKWQVTSTPDVWICKIWRVNKVNTSNMSSLSWNNFASVLTATFQGNSFVTPGFIVAAISLMYVWQVWQTTQSDENSYF